MKLLKYMVVASFSICALLTVNADVAAQEVKIRVHHFMSQKAPLHARFLVPLSERLAKASDGKIKMEIYDTMSLGGKPGDLYDQAADGAVDVILTLPGYSSGRFNRTEVFELPFLMRDPVATSKAFYDLVQSDLQDAEYEEVKILAAWVHGPGVVHSKQPIRKLEDFAGKEMRGPTRLATDMLGQFGASPVGMPLPKIPENLSKGVISGTLLPWEVTPSIKLAELVKNHTEIPGDRALYSATIVLAMNWDAYESMPENLRKILDAETGKALSEKAVNVMVEADKFGRSKAEGNNFIALEKKEVTRWIKAVEPVYTRWTARAKDKGFDGGDAIEQAQKLITANR